MLALEELSRDACAGRLPIVASAVRKIGFFSVATQSRNDMLRRGCHAPIAPAICKSPIPAQTMRLDWCQNGGLSSQQRPKRRLDVQHG
jgi:hypothetical protein